MAKERQKDKVKDGGKKKDKKGKKSDKSKAARKVSAKPIVAKKAATMLVSTGPQVSPLAPASFPTCRSLPVSSSPRPLPG